MRAAGSVNMGTPNRRVMVFEDNFLLAGTLADTLGQIGCDVVACVGTFEQAMAAAETEHCDLAIVDINLRGVEAYPILERLQARGIPFVLATASAQSDIPKRYEAAPVVPKPYNTAELLRAIASLHGKDSA